MVLASLKRDLFRRNLAALVVVSDYEYDYEHEQEQERLDIGGVGMKHPVSVVSVHR